MSELTPESEKDAFWQGALNVCAVVVTMFFVLWTIWSTARPVCPQAAVAAPQPAGAAPAPPIVYRDVEVRECDKAVAALLTSGDLGEITRAGIIIQNLNCGIGKRLAP